MKKSILLVIISIFFLSFTEKKPIYPVPTKQKNMLFYIQRNLNTNTIIYEAIFDKNGNLNLSNPIKVYWLMYADKAQKEELNAVEKRLAYGVECKKNTSEPLSFKVKMLANEEKEFVLEQIAPFKAKIYTKINNLKSELTNMYIFSDNSSFWPEVKYINVWGISLIDQVIVFEKIVVE